MLNTFLRYSFPAFRLPPRLFLFGLTLIEDLISDRRFASTFSAPES